VPKYVAKPRRGHTVHHVAEAVAEALLRYALPQYGGLTYES
jgi:hypothetical protein